MHHVHICRNIERRTYACACSIDPRHSPRAPGCPFELATFLWPAGQHTGRRPRNSRMQMASGLRRTPAVHPLNVWRVYPAHRENAHFMYKQRLGRCFVLTQHAVLRQTSCAGDVVQNGNFKGGCCAENGQDNYYIDGSLHANLQLRPFQNITC